MSKRLLVLIVAAAAALGATVASAGTVRDVYTDGSVLGPRDPYTVGGKAGKFDPYTDGARVGDKRDTFTDGAKSGRFDPYTDGTHASALDLAASALDNARAGDGTLYGYRV